MDTVFDSCKVCGQKIGYIDCPTGGWWAHEVHPKDDHDAEGRELAESELDQGYE